MIQPGNYFIVANHAGTFSSLCLDVPGSSLNDAVVIQQFGYHGGKNQQWLLDQVGSNVFTITNVNSRKSLDVPSGLPIAGLPIQQYRPHGGLNQQWRFETSPAVTGPELFRPEFHRIYSVATGMALDVPNGSTKWREKIQQYRPHQGWNQTWLLRRV